MFLHKFCIDLTFALFSIVFIGISYKLPLTGIVDDDEYTWITKQLNAFYNGDVTQTIDTFKLFKNLKN